MTDQRAENSVLIAAGGTGGHVFPALAVAECLQLQDVPVIWLGTHKGLEARVVPEAGISFLPLAVSGFRGKGLLERVQSLLGLLKAVFYVIRVIRDERVGVVLGMGGYASMAAGLASAICRRPLVIQEQNAVAGTANRLLARFARKIFTGFPLAIKPAEKVEFSGNPVRRKLLEAAEAGGRNDDSRFAVTVIGGSQGAMAINTLVPQALIKFHQRVAASESGDPSHQQRIWLRHQSGVAHYQTVLELYSQHASGLGELTEVSVLDFIDDMHAVLATSDLVIARAGALTLAELQVLGVPSILIPLPGAIDDHQKMNAVYMQANGASLLLEQDQTGPDQLAETLYRLWSDRQALAAMAASARKIARPEASQRVANACMELCYG